MIELLDFSAQSNTAREFVEILNTLGATPAALASAIEDASTAFGGRMVDVATPLLALTVGIRVLIVVVKEIIDGDLVELFGEVFFTLLMGLFLGMLLAWWAGGLLSVPEFSKQLLGAVMSAAHGSTITGGALADGIGEIFTPVFQSFTGVLGAIWDVMAKGWTKAFNAVGAASSASSAIQVITGYFSGGVSGAASSAASSALGMSSLWVVAALNTVLAFIALLAVVLLFCMLIYHMLSGFIVLNVVIAFGPLTLAAYPLIDTWAKKAISSIAGSIMQMAAAILLLSVLRTILDQTLNFMNLLGAAP